LERAHSSLWERGALALPEGGQRWAPKGRGRGPLRQRWVRNGLQPVARGGSVLRCVLGCLLLHRWRGSAPGWWWQRGSSRELRRWLGWAGEPPTWHGLCWRWWWLRLRWRGCLGRKPPCSGWRWLAPLRRGWGRPLHLLPGRWGLGRSRVALR
jgi:hypothetical protein